MYYCIFNYAASSHLFMILLINLLLNLQLLMPSYYTLHLLPFIKEQSMFIRVNRIFNSAFQISLTQT